MAIAGGVIVAFIVICMLIGTVSENHKLQHQINTSTNFYHNLSIENDQLKKENGILKRRELSQAAWIKEQETIKSSLFKEIDDNIMDRAKAYKWLAPMIADIRFALKERNRDPEELVTSKRSSETQARVTVLANEKTRLLEENAVLKYQLEYIKALIPEAEEIIEYEEDEPAEDVYNENWIYKRIPKDEYDALPEIEKNKRAFEYYLKRRKTKWQIGRDFEMYIGYLLQRRGYTVTYYGIEKKLQDMGRDLIAENDKSIHIIQCKYWSQEKIIHEKHILQLYGTAIMYKIQHSNTNKILSAAFYTHTKLSDAARKIAKALHIKVIENVELGEYPRIKCNIGHDEYGYKTRIYHLPMDQQYDRVKIEPKKGEFYAFTVEEAEKAGFTRAHKWRGNTPGSGLFASSKRP